MFAAGIYRSGQAYFHRGVLWNSGLTMSGVLDNLQTAENRVVAFYRKLGWCDEELISLGKVLTSR